MIYLALPDQYRSIGPGELYYDSGYLDPYRFKMWSTVRQCELMRNAEHIYGDGTFKRPEVFCQHYIIYAEYLGKIFPCVYVLMSFRTQKDYERVIRKLMDWIVSSYSIVSNICTCIFTDNPCKKMSHSIYILNIQLH